MTEEKKFHGPVLFAIVFFLWIMSWIFAGGFFLLLQRIERLLP